MATKKQSTESPLRVDVPDIELQTLTLKIVGDTPAGTVRYVEV